MLARGSHLMDIHGTAPIDASSGAHTHHRLSRAGNRRINHVLYIAGIVQLRGDTEGRAYHRAKRAAGKTGMEALRCLRRRLSDVVYRQLVADAALTAQAVADVGAGPGGHSGASLLSSAADLTPDVGSSDQPLPGPAAITLPSGVTAGKPTGPGAAAIPGRRAGGVNVQRPTGRTTLTPTSAGAQSTAAPGRPLDSSTPLKGANSGRADGVPPAADERATRLGAASRMLVGPGANRALISISMVPATVVSGS